MNGDDERAADVAQLHALIERALASGKLPPSLLDVTKMDVDALDPERVARLKLLVKSGDLDALKEAVENRTAPLAGYNRGSPSEPEDPGLDAARERVRDRVRRQRNGPGSPEAQTESS